MTREAELARLAQEATSQEQLIDELARLSSRWIGADRAVFLDVREPPGAVRLVGFDEEATRRFLAIQPIMPSVASEIERAFRALDETRIYLDDEHYTERDRRKMRVFSEVSRPQHVYSDAAVMLEWRGKPTAVILFQRVGAAGERFTREAMAPLVELMPMVSLVWAGASGQATLSEAALEVPLTPRERELCRYVVRGLRNNEIAQLIGTSRNTVRNQLSMLFKKVEVTSRTELAIWADGRFDGRDDEAPPLGVRVIDGLTSHARHAQRRPSGRR